MAHERVKHTAEALAERERRRRRLLKLVYDAGSLREHAENTGLSFNSIKNMTDGRTRVSDKALGGECGHDGYDLGKVQERGSEDETPGRLREGCDAGVDKFKR